MWKQMMQLVPVFFFCLTIIVFFVFVVINGEMALKESEFNTFNRKRNIIPLQWVGRREAEAKDKITWAYWG